MSINHASFLIQNCSRSERFYKEILNLTPSVKRPELGYPGIWYDLGDQQLHLLECNNPYVMEFMPEHGGRDRHLALNTDDLETIIASLEARQITYSKSKSGRDAIFFRDCDDNVLEVISTPLIKI